MASRTSRTIASIALLLGATLSAASVSARPDDRARVTQSGAQEMFTLGLRGVYFVPNHGQWADDEVIYGLKSRGLDVAFRESSVTMHLSRERSEHSEPGCVTPTSGADLSHFSMLSTDHSADRIRSGSRSLLDADVLTHEAIRGVEDSAPAYEHLTLTVSFPGSNPVAPRGAQLQAAKFNYFVGGEGRGVASNVPSFSAVIYENLYDGVDLLVCGNDDGVMKYEFHCFPGADYSQIRIHYDGVDSLCANEDGDLEIATTFGTLRDGKPIVWQDEGGTAVSAVETSQAESALTYGRPSP